MANPSILAAFERMWQHVVVLAGHKADANHSHDDLYYTESEIDTKLEGKAAADHAHNDKYYTEAEVDNRFTQLGKGIVEALDGKADAEHAHDGLYDALGTAQGKFDEAQTAIDDLNEGFSEVILGMYGEDLPYDEETETLVTIRDIANSEAAVALDSAIVNNLTTNSADKVLSAAQGVAIQVLIDALWAEVNAKASSLSDLGITATAAELNYVDGVTSAIQAQVDSKANMTDLNRATAVNVADENYTTYMARGVSLNSIETEPTINGTIAWVYE